MKIERYEIKRFCNNPKFLVILMCQGQPFYYQYHFLISALVGYAINYLQNKKYGMYVYLRPVKPLDIFDERRSE